MTAEGRPIAGAAAQPRRLAVLALLAVAGDRGITRERIVTCLWPDYDAERGRHALTQALYALRRDLGAEELFLGQQELRLNPDLITSDYAQFHDALRRDAPERAIECYRGPFLQGFHLPRADNFEHWVEEQRDALNHEYGRALEAAAQRAAQRQDFPAAVGYWKRRAAQDPLNPRVALKLMEALAAQGAVVEALQHARVYETMVKQELDLPPDPEVTALAERLRRVPRSAPVSAPPAETQPSTATLPEPAGREQRAAEGRVSSGWARLEASASQESTATVAVVSPRGTRRWGLPAIIFAVVLTVVWVVVTLARPHPPVLAERGRPVFAVGAIADYSGGEPGKLGRPLVDMLATNLARGSGFRVISNGRMLELMWPLRQAGDSAEVVNTAARQAGATQLIDGALYATAPNRFRLDLRRVDLATGATIAAYRVEGDNLFALADSGAGGLMRDLGGGAPQGSLAEATTSSVKAYQAYEEGLRKYYDGDRSSAERLFRQALDLDPEYAQAAFYYGLSTSSGSHTETMDRLRRALDLSGHAGDRDRLIIRAEWAYQNSSPALVALAETLMVRYPEELDGYRYAGEGAILLGNYRQAEQPFRRILALDSVNHAGVPGQRCRLCDAYFGLATVYAAVDSPAREHAVVREWLRRDPSSAPAWRLMADIYGAEGHEDSGLAALRTADSLEPTNPVNRLSLITQRSMAEEYAHAEALLRTEVEMGPILAYRTQAKWDLANLLRQVGRLREALPLAHAFRTEIRERLLPGAAPYNALLEGQIRFELGQYRTAAALFDSIAVGQEGRMDISLRSRDRIWAWVHEADALAQLGDTARLRFLADSMEVLGRNVAHARDRVLHAHVRGLIARLQGRDVEAAVWFRRAIVSPVIGFTRSNYELAGTLLRTHRPREAAGILVPALRGFPDGSTLYVTRTDVEARLAEAFDSAGQADSALVYYKRVSRAWEHADPQFGPRRDSIALALRRLERAARR